MRRVLYGLLNVLLAPLYLTAYPFYQLPLLWSRGRVSGTTYEPFTARVTYHLLGVRPDATAVRLAPALPATNPVVMWLLLRPMAWASRAAGHLPAFLTFPPPRPVPMTGVVALRCEIIDRVVAEHVARGHQVVILGAGWDTRAYGPSGPSSGVYEVDRAATQQVKRRALDRTGVDDGHVTFVSCDFNQEHWLDVLSDRGFDRARRTVVVREGVSMYLEPDAVADVLRSVASLPAGSRIVFDFFTREWLFDTTPGSLSRWGIAATYGERFVFGFPGTPDVSAGLAAALAEQGLALESCEPISERSGPPIGGVAVAVSR